MADRPERTGTEALQPYLSPAAAWALSVGTSTGWGCLVITSGSHLSQAGPVGSVLGLLIGAALMLLVAGNYHYMANLYPDAGGIYAYTKKVFGYDRAFLVWWFLSLTYMSMFWANATSLPLFARYFLQRVFSFGYLYTVFGYEVYLGETLLTLFVILIVALLALVVLMSMIWSGRREEAITSEALYGIQRYFEGTADTAALSMEPDVFIARQLGVLHRSNVLNTMLVIGLFILALAAMLINHFSLRRLEARTAQERDTAREVAYRDPLTGVKSKHAYVEHESMMADRIYRGEAGEFAVLVCDVNGLKHINDTLGHQAGDAYIRAASEMICSYYKRSPVFRIGGDEFAVILQGEDFENRHEILSALNEVIEGNIGTGGVVASLGMTDFHPETDNTFHAVFTRADGLMYERKKQLKAMGAVTRE